MHVSCKLGSFGSTDICRCGTVSWNHDEGACQCGLATDQHAVGSVVPRGTNARLLTDHGPRLMNKDYLNLELVEPVEPNL